MHSLGQIASSDTGFQVIEKVAHDAKRVELNKIFVSKQRAFERKVGR